MGWSQVLYAKVARQVHQDAKFRALPRNARYAWLALLTSDLQSTLPGFFRASEALTLDELVDFTPKEWHAARDELIGAGMLRIDEKERLLWLVNAIEPRYNSPDNPNVARSWARQILRYGPHGMAIDYLKALNEASEMWSKGPKDAFRGALQAAGCDINQLTTVVETFGELAEQVAKRSANSPKVSSATATATAYPNVDPISVSGAVAPAPKKRAKKTAAFPIRLAIDELRKCPRITLPDSLEPKHVGILVDLTTLAKTPQAIAAMCSWLMGAEKHRDVIGLEELRIHASTWLAAAQRAGDTTEDEFYRELGT